MTDIITLAGRQYRWDERWARGHHDGSSPGWAHHGIVVTDDSRIVTFTEDRPEVLILDQAGEILARWTVGGVEGHGLALTGDGDGQILWISDIGTKNQTIADGTYPAAPTGPLRGAVRAYTLAGRELFKIEAPDLPAYVDGDFCPAQIAVYEPRLGGSGDIWVADCYGQALVHRFTADGQYLQTLSGEEGAGRYSHPHPSSSIGAATAPSSWSRTAATIASRSIRWKANSFARSARTSSALPAVSHKMGTCSMSPSWTIASSSWTARTI